MKKIWFYSGWLLLSGCSMSYVIKQGSYQLKMLAGAEPIELALRSPDLGLNERHKLMLIQQVRQYCQNKLGLTINTNYKNINLSWHHIIYNISASNYLALKPYTWWFPVIGAVPYKGFFDERDADNEEQRLKKLGLDTQKRKVGAYSTLGYFSDPVWPSMLAMSNEALVELIIHELSHATLYFPNQTPFNETFANFMGHVGTIEFYKDSYGSNSVELVKLEKYYRDINLYNNFFNQLFAELEELYNSEKSDEKKLAGKKFILQNAQINYANLPKDYAFKNIDWSQINNAYLLGFKRYNSDDKIFYELLSLSKGDFKVFLTLVSQQAQGEDLFAALRQYLDQIKAKI